METILIRGGNRLQGEVEISSAKNSVLPILAATILCEGEVVLQNFPMYDDTKNMLKILQDLGAKISFIDKSVKIDTSNITSCQISQEMASKLRSSIFSLGAILGRCKKAKVGHPGGCTIGARPIDLHIKGLECLNAKITDRHGYITCDGKNMRGAIVNLDFPSVGATENIMMASVLIKGKTQIINCAKEPEIVDLANFLNKMGAKISGAGTSVMYIEGVKKLHSCVYKPISDRIITGTYLIAGAMTRGSVCLTNTNSEHISALVSKLKNNGCKIHIKGDKINLDCDKRLKNIAKIETLPYPGFPTDMQPQIMALMSICKGVGIIVENMFESRFKHVAFLNKMGADIVVKDKLAFVKGVPLLYGAEVESTDLRGGACLVLAGLVAEGYTKVKNVCYIDRGYEHIEKDLQCLGANIERYIET